MSPVSRTVALVATVQLCALCAWIAPAAAQTTPRPTRILLVYQQQAEAQSMLEFTQRLQSTVRDELGPLVEFYQEALDLDRFRGPERLPLLARYFVEKYGGREIDVVVPIGRGAFRFAADYLGDVFRHVPVVLALGVAPEPAGTAVPENFTGRFAVAPRFAATLSMARRLQPDAKQVVVLGGSSSTDSTSVSAAVSAVAAARDTLRLTVLQGLSLETLLAKLRQVPRHSIVLFTSYRLDGHGQAFDALDIVGTIARASAAPVYSQVRSHVGEGIVGGSVFGFDEEGVRTARLILRVIRRRSGEPMPPAETIAKSFVADWRQLRRWGLSETHLPAGTEVLFREPTLWQRYRTVILLTLGVIGVESLLIGLLLLERRRRKRAQLAVEEQTAYEQTIARLTADAVRHAPGDAPCALEDALAHVATYAKASAATLVQYSELPNEPPTRLIWPADADTADRELSAEQAENRQEFPLVADGMVVGALELRRALDGQRWPAGHVTRLEAASEIIAGAIARGRTVRAIRREEELNRAVLTSVSSQIAILDRHGAVIRVNDAWRDLAHWTEVDREQNGFVGWNYLDECTRAELRGCRAAAEVRQGIEAVLQRQTWPFRLEYQDSAREDRWYEIFVDRLQLSQGGAIVMHVDITARRLAEQRADEARRQVAHLGRVALVGELAATISHELRQPLAAIRANAEAGSLLTTRTPHDAAEAREIFDDIIADDQRAVEVVEGVRRLLRKEDPRPTIVDLNQVSRDAVRLLQRDAVTRNIRLELALAAAPLRLSGNAPELQQVVLNLVLNALEATSISGNERLVAVRTVLCVDHAELLVHDSGPGIAPGLHEMIFESFFSTKARGLGLGLAIVRSIVERHNGHITAENHPLRGAVFRVWLPLLAGAPPQNDDSEKTKAVLSLARVSMHTH